MRAGATTACVCAAVLCVLAVSTGWLLCKVGYTLVLVVVVVLHAGAAPPPPTPQPPAPAPAAGTTPAAPSGPHTCWHGWADAKYVVGALVTSAVGDACLTIASWPHAGGATRATGGDSGTTPQADPALFTAGVAAYWCAHACYVAHAFASERRLVRLGLQPRGMRMALAWLVGLYAPYFVLVLHPSVGALGEPWFLTVAVAAYLGVSCLAAAGAWSAAPAFPLSTAASTTMPRVLSNQPGSGGGGVGGGTAGSGTPAAAGGVATIVWRSRAFASGIALVLASDTLISIKDFVLPAAARAGSFPLALTVVVGTPPGPATTAWALRQLETSVVVTYYAAQALVVAAVVVQRRGGDRQRSRGKRE